MSLMHPNILLCYGTTHLDGNISMVLELSSDGSLTEVSLTILNTYNYEILFFNFSKLTLKLFS